MSTDSWVEPFLCLQGLRGAERRISHVTTLWWTCCLRPPVHHHWEDWAANMAACESLQQGLIAQVCHLEFESPSATCLLLVQTLRWMRLMFHVTLGLSSERLCTLLWSQSRFPCKAREIDPSPLYLFSDRQALLTFSSGLSDNSWFIAT